MSQVASAEAPTAVEVGGGGGSGLGRYLAGKVGGGLISLLLVVVLGFFLFRVIPGDPVQTLTRGHPVTAAQKVALRHQFGLDRPLWRQFFTYLNQTVHGNFGTSFAFAGQSVGHLIATRLWPTILLVGTAAIISIVLGAWLGTRSAWRHGSAFDRTQTSIALTLWSAPTFWLGLILLVVFGVGIGPIPGLFPTGGMSSPTASPGALNHVIDVLHHLVLPCVTLVAVLYAQNLLVMRSSLLDEMGSDYLVTARAKGLRDDVVRRRHAVPNALLPTVTLIFLQLGFVVSGAVTVETVFSWPGLGSLLYEGLSTPDLPLVQGTFIVFSGAVVVMNVLADVVYRFLDPRVRAV